MGLVVYWLFWILSIQYICGAFGGGMARRHLFLIGGYADEIVVAALQEEQVHRIASYPSGSNPSFLALHPFFPIVYSVNEIEDGTVEAFEFHRKTGEISPLCSAVPTQGSSPAFISVDPTGRWLFFANYNGGSYGAVRIDPSSGKLEGTQPASLVRVPKLGRNTVNPRQEGPHPHQILLDCRTNLVYVCDLGSDQIEINKLDRETGKLIPHGAATVHAGSGPRHMVFTSDSRFAYVINELSNTVHQFVHDSLHGALHFVKEWPTLDDSVPNKANCTAAEIALSPDGRFLYASNRGNEQDTIAVYRVESNTGELEFLGLDYVGGSGPRHFTFDPSGRLVVVALEKSNRITLHRRNKRTGRLSLISSLESVQAPTYIQFIHEHVKSET